METATLPSRETTVRDRALRVSILIIWVSLAGYLVSHHAFWRDEVRALTVALRGDSWAAMLRGVGAEGHPILWYVLLRAAHDLVPVREVLPALAAAIGALAASLLALRAPFGPRLIALILFSAFCLFEYTVSARDYGLSMLAIFLFADRYPKWRDSGVGLGLLLALLCNSNVPSVFLAGALTLFWILDVLGEDGLHWTQRVRTCAINAGIAAAGALACLLTVYPPVQDAAAAAPPITAEAIGDALAFPAKAFLDLIPKMLGESGWMSAFLALALVGAPLGLVRAPAALLSSVLLLLVMVLFFRLVYPGGYRHEALYLVYLIAMYWLVAIGRGGRWPSAWRIARARLEPAAWVGRLLFVALLALQLPNGLAYVLVTAQGMPESRSRDLAELLHTRGLGNAILVADPDMMLEALPYYVDNPLWQMHAQTFGQTVRFTRAARLEISLGDMLVTMRALHARTGRPVVAVLQIRPDPAMPPSVILEAYNWRFASTPEQVRAFQAATTRIAAFGPTVSDESYDVYLLR